MTQRAIFRSGFSAHKFYLLIILAILIYTLVVELCERQFAPFDGFVPEMNNILGVLRIGFAVLGLVGVAIVPIILWWSPFAGSSAAHIFACALLELPSLYGLMLFLIGGNRLDFYGFAAPAFVGLLLLWTQISRWNRFAAEEAESE